MNSTVIVLAVVALAAIAGFVIYSQNKAAEAQALAAYGNTPAGILGGVAGAIGSIGGVITSAYGAAGNSGGTERR